MIARSWFALAIAILCSLQATSSEDVSDVSNNCTSIDEDLDDLQAAFLRSSADCGRAPINPLSKERSYGHHMTKGKRQLYGEWPSFARLHVNWLFRDTLCGGVLISEKHVLTAAHCMFQSGEIIDKYRARAEQMTVIMGEDQVDQKDAHEERFDVISTCVPREYYLGSGTRYDFAVLTLNKRARFNNYIQPACLPDKESPDLKRATCYLVGMGAKYIVPGKRVIPARTVEKQPMIQVSCEPYRIEEDDASRTCWTMRGDQGDSCAGDSGAPILCLDARRRWTVASLVSYGTELCNGAKPYGFTGVYARIDKLLPMIKGECQVD